MIACFLARSRQASIPTIAKTLSSLVLSWMLATHSGISDSQEAGVAAGSPLLFGYKESARTSLSLFPQWIGVLKRHAKDDLKDADCNSPKFNLCHLREWQGHLAGLGNKPPMEQIAAVNAYGNQKKYVLDIDNYGLEDYWAIPREFLYQNGDCEDFAIFKYLSLRQLGFSTDSMRVVVLRDTNLRIAHAILAVYINGDALVLDNQAQEIVSQRKIAHYVPIFSINEKSWWMHTP
jgi:predicted transglutaminase-like cysteine proteinase